MKPTEIIPKFDQFLSEKRISFEAVVIGGSALSILNVIQRETIDVDCLDPKIPEPILKAASEFRLANKDLLLIEKWINNGPENLLRDLSEDWRDRKMLIYQGKALTLFTLGRVDLLKTKLFAYCDRGDDFQDCIALKPTQSELAACTKWVSERDANPMWPKHVETQFHRLKKALGHE